MKAKQVELKSWKRFEQYKFFNGFKDPFFNICCDVDVTNLKQMCVHNDLSYFILSAYILAQTVNKIEEFKYRINENGVICYDKIHVACTILRDDKTFGFAYYKYCDNFESFYQEAKKITESVKKSSDFNPRTGEDDMVHTSILPWISFNSVEHAKNANTFDSIPKIVFGKLHNIDKKIYMPVSVSVHHSLMDAYHVGEFFKIYQKHCNEANKIIHSNH